MKINLASTIHDPEAGMKWMSDKYLSDLQDLFDEIYLTSSPYTDQDYLEELSNTKIKINKRKDNKIGRNYFDSIKRANQSDTNYVFYCDFDRTLHWIKEHPDELKNLINQLREENSVDYIVCQRTEQDYKNHQESLYLTEQLPNKIISDKMGLDEQKDFFGGSFIYSKKAADIIIDQGGYDGLSFWGSWPVLLKDHEVEIEFRKFSGLGWETADWHRQEVKELGGADEFKQSLNSKEEWKKRTKMANEFVKNILN